MLDVTFFYRATTEPFTYTLPEDADSYNVIRIAFAQNEELLVKEYAYGSADPGMELDGKDVIVTLTQEETKMFKPGFAYTQVRALTSEDEAPASKEFRIIVRRILDDEIMGGE